MMICVCAVLVLASVWFTHSLGQNAFHAGYQRAILDEKIYSEHNAGHAPDFDWLILAEQHPKKEGQTDEAWLLEMSFVQQQWEREHYR